jgi:pyruvate formate lyase activating enzyme
MNEALLYKKLEDNAVQCHICQRRCIIKCGETGYCRTRVNKKGTLYSLIYGKVSSLMVSPIEKKPVYHFFPGSKWLSLGSFGCNFLCPGCQNWDIAHAEVENEVKMARVISPEKLIELAKQSRCTGISWTYNEPTLWLEYFLEGAKLAKKNHLYTNWVTNGFITSEALDVIGPYLDVFRVDLKGFSKDAYKKIAHVHDFSGILEIISKAAKKWGMHVEIITNVITGYNDSEEEIKKMASWISTELGNDTPWHITRFYPHLDLSHVMPTPVKTLEKFRQIGLKEGLYYVYLGNIYSHTGESTYCPGCKKRIIHREGFDIRKLDLKEGRCAFCNFVIKGKF